MIKAFILVALMISAPVFTAECTNVAASTAGAFPATGVFGIVCGMCKTISAPALAADAAGTADMRGVAMCEACKDDAQFKTGMTATSKFYSKDFTTASTIPDTTTIIDVSGACEAKPAASSSMIQAVASALMIIAGLTATF